LHRAGRRRHPGRPDRDDRGGRSRLRAALADHRAQRRGAGPWAGAGRRVEAGLDRRAGLLGAVGRRWRPAAGPLPGLHPRGRRPMRMSRREAWASAALVFVVAVVVRAWAASLNTFPRPQATASYVGVARQLLEGRGLVSDAIWSYGTPPLEFPRPAFEVWLPLPTFLAALPIALLGATFAPPQGSST